MAASEGKQGDMRGQKPSNLAEGCVCYWGLETSLCDITKSHLSELCVCADTRLLEKGASLQPDEATDRLGFPAR